jgi:hypothetical protein
LEGLKGKIQLGLITAGVRMFLRHAVIVFGVDVRFKQRHVPSLPCSAPVRRAPRVALGSFLVTVVR